jgi:hypothetical protein
MCGFVPRFVLVVILLNAACSRFESVDSPDVPVSDPGDVPQLKNLCKGVSCESSDLPPCYFESCDLGTGLCVVQAELNGSSCVDTDWCTTDTQCQEGVCVGKAVICPDDGDCRRGVCLPESGCALEDEPDGQVCDDGDECTHKDVCLSGACTFAHQTDCKGECAFPQAPDESCNVCVCDAQTGGCVKEPVNIDVGCNADDDGCTVNDHCDETGACVPGDPRDCADVFACTDDECVSLGDDESECHNDIQPDACLIKSAAGVSECWAHEQPNSDNLCLVCDSFNDTEKWTPLPDGFPCEDGDGCTLNDGCKAAACSAGVLVTCDDQLACTQDLCVSDGVTTHHCNFDIDDDACVIADTCYQTGDVDPANSCQQCDPAQSSTSWTVLAEATACDLDSNGCTNEACSAAGVCSQVDQVICNDTLPCTVDLCVSKSPTTHECISNPDGSGCVFADGVCVAAQTPNPDNVCQKCLPNANVSQWSNVPDWMACVDGDGCTANDVCLSGVCKPGPLQSCNDGLGCTQGVCFSDGPTAHHCTYATLPGWCVIEQICEPDGKGKPGNPCLACEDSESNVAWTPVVSGTLCNADSDGCTIDDKCDDLGVCQPGKDGEQVCNDALDCTNDECVQLSANSYVCKNAPQNHCVIGDNCIDADSDNPTNECEWCRPEVSETQWTPKGLPPGELPPCNADSDGCTENDACLSGVCQAGETPPCGDVLACTADACQSTGVNSYDCVHDLNAGACLIEGVCYSNADPSPTNECLVCNSATNGTDWTNASDGSSCTDASQCTHTDTCLAGQCKGQDVVCEDTNVCTADFCDPNSGCQFIPTTLPCEDGVACTGPDVCSDGSCISGPAANCPCMAFDRARTFGASCVVVNKSSPLLENDGFTIEFWIRTTSTKGGIVLDKRGTVDPGDADWWISYVAPGGQGRLQFHFGATNSVDSIVGMSGAVINDGVWRHVALVWSSSNQLTWWVDGDEAGSVAVSNNLPMGNALALTMGCDSASQQSFSGDLDEVRVSTFARYKTPFSPPSRHIRDIMTRALWHLDEGPGDIVADATGNGYDGFGVGGAAVVTADVSATLAVCCGNDVLDIGEECDDFNTNLGDGCGPYCDGEGPLAQRSLFFNGSTGCIEVAGEGMLTGVDSMTIEFWIKTTATNAIVFDRAPIPFQPDWRIFLTGAGKLAFQFIQQFSSPTAMPIADGTWHHALVHAVALPAGDPACMTGKTDPNDAECTRIQWYVDGVKSGLPFGAKPSVVLDDDLDLRIGCAFNFDTAYTGMLDDIRIQTQVGVDDLDPFAPATVLVPNDSTALLLNFDYPSLDAGTPDLSGNERHGVIQEPVGVQLVSDNP